VYSTHTNKFEHKEREQEQEQGRETINGAVRSVRNREKVTKMTCWTVSNPYWSLLAMTVSCKGRCIVVDRRIDDLHGIRQRMYIRAGGQ